MRAGGRKLIVASEYEHLTKRWLAAQGVEATFLRAYGATGKEGEGGTRRIHVGVRFVRDGAYL